jgi:hypothetical protein
MLRVLLQLLVLLHYVLLIELLCTLGINMWTQIRHSLALTVGHPLKTALKMEIGIQYFLSYVLNQHKAPHLAH